MANMNGKTVVITGATNGIGKVSALELAKMGATVIVVGRSAERVQNTVSEINSATNSDRAKPATVDLSLMAQVRKLAAHLNEHYPRIDVLLNNAGAFYTQREVTAEGLELTFALNHMSYFLLTQLMIDNLTATARERGSARIVNVSSDVHTGAKLDFANLQGENKFSGFGQYSVSKLLNIMFTEAQARRLADTGVTVNALHPGFVASGFFQNKSGGAAMFVRLVAPIFKLTGTMVAPEQGAATNIYLASAPEVEGKTGGYYSDCKPAKPSAAAQDHAAQERLWTISEEIAGIKARAGAHV